MPRYAYQSVLAVNYFQMLCVTQGIYIYKLIEFLLYRLSARYIIASISKLVFYKRTYAKYHIEILLVKIAMCKLAIDKFIEFFAYIFDVRFTNACIHS